MKNGFQESDTNSSMKFSSKSLIVVLTFALLIGGSLFYLYKQRVKVVYVNTYSLYNEFKLKKELEEKLKKSELARRVILDSIKGKIQLLSVSQVGVNSAETEARLNNLKEAYFLKEKEFNKENESQAQSYTDQVWEQLNQYVKDFGSEKGFDYILGATGEGNLMYAKESNDISKDLIEYVNKKYEGKK